MFFHYRSKSLFPLIRKLSEQLCSDTKDSVLEPSWIIVQNREAREWITHQLADFNGIAANIEFILPSELTWKLFRMVHKDFPKILPSDRLPMEWSLFELLKKNLPELRRSGFPFEIEDDNLRLQLASQIADVFDLYQIFRPEMIQSWSDRALSTKNKHELWQSVLWNLLRDQWRVLNPGLPDRSEAFLKLKKHLLEDEPGIFPIPGSIYVFGLSQSSGPFFDLLNALAQNRNIHLYTGVFDEPETISNIFFRELVNEWSASKSDTLKLLNTYQLDQSDLESTRNNVLTEFFKEPSENRIEIHSCHNTRREAEVLKSEILDFLDDNPEISPDEILILVPDMEQYVSVIDSVFKFAKDEPSIPIGLPFLNNGNMPDVMLGMLDLIQSDFKVSSVLDLLESDPVRSRFKLEMDDISLIRYWLSEMNIHWGLEETDSDYSLEKAIKSAFNGFVIEADEFEVYQQTVPFREISNSDKLFVLAKLSEYLEHLKEIRRYLNDSNTAYEWCLLLKEWILILFDQDKTKGLSAIVDKWTNSIAYANDQSIIEFSVFSSWVKGQLSDLSAGSGRFGNGVQLSTYIPFRSLPFKYVAILGLNENVFPRNPVRPPFDLIQGDPKPGDRIMAKDDRLLFLEILNSTREKLHISYLGKDQYSENVRLPSILVQKLIDAIQSVHPDFKVTEHSLHEFNPINFIDPKIYSGHNRKISEGISLSDNSSPVFIYPEDLRSFRYDESELSIQELVSFFQHPCKYHAQNILQISSRTNDLVLSDRENFKLDGLIRYSVRQEIVNGVVSDIPASELFRFLDVSGYLPKGIAGKKMYNEQLSEIYDLFEVAAHYRKGDAYITDIDLPICGLRLYGRIQDLYGTNRIIFRAGSSRAKDLISLWIHHLISSVLLPDFKESMLVFKEKKNSKTITSVHKLGEIENAPVILENLVDWFKTAHSQISDLCFFPESSLEFASKDEELTKLKMWHGQEHGYSGDGGDFYNQLYWRGTDLLKEKSFTDNAHKFWDPLLSVLTESKPGE